MAELLGTLFRIYEVIVIVRVLFSWIQFDTRNPLSIWVYRLTEPLLDPIRRLLPLDRLGIDLSPLILLLLLSFVQTLLLKLIF